MTVSLRGMNYLELGNRVPTTTEQFAEHNKSRRPGRLAIKRVHKTSPPPPPYALAINQQSNGHHFRLCLRPST